MKMLCVKVVGYAVLIFAAVFVYARFYENKLLFFPSRKISLTPQNTGLPYEDVFLKSPAGATLNGWLVRAGHPRQAATILFFHGNAGNVSHRLEKIALFHELGLNVFILDYQGYGKSTGRPSETGIYQDAQAAYDYLLQRSDILKDKIVVYGESLGGAVAVDLASQHPLAGIILESTFSSAQDMAKVILPFVPTCLVRVKMDSLSKISRVTAPKLFIHSRYDEIVPFRLAQKLFNAAPQPKEFLEIDGDHNEGYRISFKLYREGISHFLQKYVRVP